MRHLPRISSLIKFNNLQANFDKIQLENKHIRNDKNQVEAKHSKLNGKLKALKTEFDELKKKCSNNFN